MIAPRWLRLRVGPYLRRERDKRNYFLYFQNTGYVGGVRRLYLLLTKERFTEGTVVSAGPGRSGIVVFSGMKGSFFDLKGRDAELVAELRRITRPRYLPSSLDRRAYIAVHVRRGDFNTPRSAAELRAGGYNYRIPVAWYVEALRAIRHALPFQAEAWVFSDGDPAELSDLLNEPATRLRGGKHAMLDLLSLAGATALVASASTFSMWSSFLGQAPTIWYPGQRRQCLLDSNTPGALEPEWDAGDLPTAFVETLRLRWTAAISE